MLNAYDAHPAGAPQSVQWFARVRLNTSTPNTIAQVYLRDHIVTISSPVSFKPSGDPAPSALENLLAALGGEIATGFAGEAKRKSLILDNLEITLSCYLENPLVAARVRGETGSPALAAIVITLYVASPEEEERLTTLLTQTLAHFPVYSTLSRACPIDIVWKFMF